MLKNSLFFKVCFGRIFGFEGEMAEIIKYVNWMLELRSGLLALEFYSAETKKWRQVILFIYYLI